MDTSTKFVVYLLKSFFNIKILIFSEALFQRASAEVHEVNSEMTLKYIDNFSS